MMLAYDHVLGTLETILCTLLLATLTYVCIKSYDAYLLSFLTDSATVDQNPTAPPAPPATSSSAGTSSAGVPKKKKSHKKSVSEV